MYNFNFSIISGGYYKCTPAWNADSKNRDNCYKLYFPIEGSASIKVAGQWHHLSEGNIYFINGFWLEQQDCIDHMKVYWLHFMPQSHYLNLFLNKLQPIYSWTQNDKAVRIIEYERIPKLFEHPEQNDTNPVKDLNISGLISIHAYILLLISDMIEKQQINKAGIPVDIYNKLEPAVEYINNSYMKNLSLEDIAQKAFLNKVYFIRLFKKCFNMTPNNYLTMVRLNEAAILLSRSNMSIQEISDTIGYCNQFYFSKVFKSRFNSSPMQYRNSKLLP